MPWWSALRDGLRRPRAGSSVASDPPLVQRHSTPEPQPAESLPQPPEQAWRDLPALQRTLAAPIEPAAPLDAFTGSLTAHQNPSFLAPLGHRVDPYAGGLVDGLADLTPGHPIFYSAGSELPVPTAGKPAVQRKLAVQRTVAEWPARGASWLGAVDDPSVVDTVRMERPSVDVTGEGGVVAGHGTSDAPLALTVPTPSPTVSRPTVQRHAVASAGATEEPVEAAGGMEAIEGLTVSRLAESAALPVASTQQGSPPRTGASASDQAAADAPTLGRAGEVPLTGLAATSLSVPGSAVGESPGHASFESVAESAVVPGNAGHGALPTASVQRQAAQAADLAVRRTWPVVPEEPVRAAVFPAMPVVELPVARSVEPGGPSPAAAGTRTAPGLDPDPAQGGASVNPAPIGGADLSEAPLSGFAAAISAVHAGEAPDAPVQRATDLTVDGLAGPPMQRSWGAGAEGPGTTSAAGPATPVQRLTVGPGRFVQTGQAGREQAEPSPHGSGGGGSFPPAFGASAPDAPTLGTTPPAERDLVREVATPTSEHSESSGTAGSTSAEATSSHQPENETSDPEVVDGQFVDDGLPELPVVAPDQPAAARGSVAMPVLGSTPVQRATADPAGWTPVPTAGLLASRTPTLQLQQLSSAAPAPPPVQRVTFLADTVPAGAVAQRVPATAPATSMTGHSTDRQHSSSGAGSAGAVQPVGALQRSVGSPTMSSLRTAAPPVSIASGAASRPYASSERLGAVESDALGDSVRWEPVPLEQESEDRSEASPAYGTDGPAVVQRVVEFPTGPTESPAGPMSEHSRSWVPADSELVALDASAAVRQVEPPAPPRRPATVMPPMPIVQRHVAAETAPPQVHRSSSAGISFTSMFSAASEAAESGYTTVQLQADDSAHGADAAEPESAPMAPAAGLSVQREGEAPPPSAPAPGGAPAGGAPAGADLDEMARRLFEPLSARLRAEFWLDRERAGLMTDARP
jgi:hypothetical protein